jgi:hypothetical protein
MEAPRCLVCGGRHWSREACAARPAKGFIRDVGEKVLGSSSRGAAPTPSSVVTVRKRGKRGSFDRAAYHKEYMREYMRKYMRAYRRKGKE